MTDIRCAKPALVSSVGYLYGDDCRCAGMHYFAVTNLSVVFAGSVLFSNIIARGGFRHVQHVRPNRGPTKRGPHKRRFFFHFLQHGNNLCVSAPTVSGEGSRGSGGGVTGYSYIRGPTFFLNRGPAWSKSGPDPGTAYTRSGPTM